MKTASGPPGFISRWLLGWVPFWGMSLAVFRGAVLSPKDIPPILLRLNDKLLHGTEYFLLFSLAANAFRKSLKGWLTSYPYTLAFTYCLLMGAATEIAQLNVPGRVPDIKDWVVDGLGAALAWTVIFLTAGACKFFERPSHELL